MLSPHMGQATLKATRRALRRVVGVDGLAVVQNHEESLALLEHAVATAQLEVQSLAHIHETFQQRYRQIETADQARSVTLWSRLRWLWSGQ